MYAALAKKIKIAKPMNNLVLTSNSIDLLLGILSIFFSFLLLPAIISSCITGIILCIGFGMYDKLSKKIPLAATREQIETLSIESNIFSKSNIILSIVDIITGLIAMIVIGIFVNNMILNVLLCITIVKGSKIMSAVVSGMVQLKKFRALYLTLGIVSMSYISVRKNHFLRGGDKMKKFFAWIKVNPRTLAAVGSILGALVTGLIEYLTESGLGLPDGIANIVIGGLTSLGAIFAGWAGFETPNNAKLRKEAIVKDKAEKKALEEKKKKEAEYIAKAQAQLQATQDAQLKHLVEEMKKAEENKVEENKVEPVNNNIVSLS